MASHRLIAGATISLVLIASISVHAQVAMDASGMGLVIVGYDSRTCDGSIEGAIRYNSGASQVQVCKPIDGWTNWGE